MRPTSLCASHDGGWGAGQVGVAYGNPSNRFWPLMRESGILPSGWRESEELHRINNCMPYELGIGVTDIGCLPGSDAAEFGPQIMALWREDLYRRIRAHARRVFASSTTPPAQTAAGAALAAVKVEDRTQVAMGGGGSVSGGGGGGGSVSDGGECARGDIGTVDGIPASAYPRIVAFTGKRHFAGAAAAAAMPRSHALPSPLSCCLRLWCWCCTWLVCVYVCVRVCVCVHGTRHARFALRRT